MNTPEPYISDACKKAVHQAKTYPSVPLASLARTHKISLRTLQRALRRSGVPARKTPGTY